MRVILLHYDQEIELPPKLLQTEFVSVISTSQTISQLLAGDTPPTLTKDDSVTRVETRRKSVLLVDDNEINLRLASELIGLWGHDVTAANHGSKAF